MYNTPEILAPAGDMPSALAALAAGADAVYLGLKHFSARMQAENFSSGDFARLVDLAHAEERKIYVALNTFFKPSEAGQVGRMIKRLLLGPAPDGIIAQDPAIFELARQAGYAGEIHLSTLANLTHPAALAAAARLGASRVVLPRELSIDEIRTMHAALSGIEGGGLGLEAFIHGALCYCVSGRCWWSSYMGGKSGLRGRCVQPCRRVYTQGGKEGRFFSCYDLSLDVLVKTLLEMPGIKAWKIEGRKKGPHYVFHTVSAYRLLRDHQGDPAARKEAEALLGMALGRPGTRARFLPQRSVNPTAFGKGAESDPSGGAAAGGAPAKKASPGERHRDERQTSSGLLAGKIVLGKEGRPALRARMELLARDYLRIGYEDEQWHQTLPVNRALPKGGSLTLKLARHKTPKNGTPVFLIDRKEDGLLALIAEWRKKLEARDPRLKSDKGLTDFEPTPPKGGARGRRLEILLRANLPRGREGKSGVRPGTVQGIWLSAKGLDEVSRTLYGRISWWLPPVIWPDEEEHWQKLIRQALRGGARHFVTGSPWQAEFFAGAKGVALTAGPFCNITNAFAVDELRKLGFAQVIVSPELGGEDYQALPAHSPLPLGMVVSGYLPVGITRHGVEPLKSGELWFSPKREGFWTRRYGENVWIYPAWPLDLSGHLPELEKSGYTNFVHITEFPPKGAEKITRTSEFNWNIGVL